MQVGIWDSGNAQLLIKLLLLVTVLTLEINAQRIHSKAGNKLSRKHKQDIISMIC